LLTPDELEFARAMITIHRRGGALEAMRLLDRMIADVETGAFRNDMLALALAEVAKLPALH
jgi:hypothetical protein